MSALIRRKEGSFLNVCVSEFDLLVEAPLPRLLKKTKQKVSKGDFNITHFQVKSKVAIHSGTQTRSNEDFGLFRFFWKPNSRGIDVPPLCEMSCNPP
jgi:hypothetical protein